MSDKQEDENPLSEEEIKELNLYAEEQRQAAIAKYGRDIYSKDTKIGNQKVKKVNGFFDKLLSFLLGNLTLFIIIGLIIILLFVWIPLIQTYS